jgi:hypothetical protein
MAAERDVAFVERAATASIEIAAMLEAIAESARTGSAVRLPTRVRSNKAPRGTSPRALRLAGAQAICFCADRVAVLVQGG